MSFDPALGAEVRGNAGGEQAKRDGESADNPGKLDATAQHEVIEDAEDKDQNGCFRQEGRAAARGDDGQLHQPGRLSGAGAVFGNQVQIGLRLIW